MEDKDVFILEVIIDFCDRIIKSIDEHDGDFNAFENDLDFQDACMMRALQIGENVNSLSSSFKDKHPEMPWHQIVGLRNIIAHEYGSIDNIIVWNTLTKHIPQLRDFCIKQI